MIGAQYDMLHRSCAESNKEEKIRLNSHFDLPAQSCETIPLRIKNRESVEDDINMPITVFY
jgi:hypothetical protein